MQGRPELLDARRRRGSPSLPEAGSGAAVLPKLQAAVADRKTVVFRYYAIGRDEELERTVDPYGLQLVGDEWYLIGFCHLRQAVRTFRLSRIRSRVTHATRAPARLRSAGGFDLAAYRDRPPWRLGAPAGEARVRVGRRHGVVGRGALRTLRHAASCLDDGDVLFTTAYTTAEPLVAWVLGLGEHATIEGPDGAARRARRAAAPARRPARAARLRPSTLPRRRPRRRPGGVAPRRPTTGASRSTASRVSRRSPPTCSAPLRRRRRGAAPRRPRRARTST